MFCVIYTKHKCCWLLVCLQHYYYLFFIYFIFYIFQFNWFLFIKFYFFYLNVYLSLHLCSNKLEKFCLINALKLLCKWLTLYIKKTFRLKGHAGAFGCRSSLPFIFSSFFLWASEYNLCLFILLWCGIMLHMLDYCFYLWVRFTGIYSSVAWPRTYTAYSAVRLLLVWTLPKWFSGTLLTSCWTWTDI